MSSRLLTALSVSMVVHAALWAGYFGNAPRAGRAAQSLFANSVLIDPSAYEAVRRARETKPAPKAAVKKKSAGIKPFQKPAVAETEAVSAPPKAGARPALSGLAPKDAPAAKAPAAEPAGPVSAAAAVPVPQKSGADLMADPKTRGLFTDYFGLIKARIQAKLREKCEGRDVGRGSVALAFILDSGGGLRRVYVMDRDSQADPQLKALAIECLKASAPFSGFPGDFQAKQIAFNLTVYFDELS